MLTDKQIDQLNALTTEQAEVLTTLQADQKAILRLESDHADLAAEMNDLGARYAAIAQEIGFVFGLPVTAVDWAQATSDVITAALYQPGMPSGSQE